MLYEIGIKYTGDKEHDVQIKIPNIPISVDRRKFWFGGKNIPHWNEDTTNTWVKVPVLQKGTTKIYVDDSANKDLSNIDETMIFGDDFNGTTLDTTKWYTYSSSDGTLTVSGSILTISGGTTGEYNLIAQSQLLTDFIVEEKVYYSGTIESEPSSFFRLGSLTDASNGYLFHKYSVDATTTFQVFFTIATGTYSTLGALKYNYPYDDTWHITKLVVQGTTFDTSIDGTTIGSVTDTTYSSGYVGIRTYKGRLGEWDWFRIRKYLPVDPIIAYIKPYHKWWLFAQQGGIIKEFFAGVFEQITHAQGDISPTQESITHELSSKANTEEDITQSCSSTVSNEELITQNSESASSTNEQITQSLTIAVNSLEQIIKEYDFKASNLEQISNTKDGKASSFEAITQENQVIINTEENIINEYDFVASTLESIKNDITSKAGVIEENTQLKGTIVSTCEQMMNIFEFHASTLESIRNQIESIAGTKESISNQTTVEVSTNEQMMNIYEFFGGAVEEIQKSVQSLASVSEEIANGNIALASALEEIEQIVVGAKPIFVRTITEIKKLKSKIEEVL